MALDLKLAPLSDAIRQLTNTEPLKTASQELIPNESFSNILKDALDTAAATDKSDKASTIELLAGTTDDMSGLMLDAQKAEIALSLALQLRNKVIDAYNELMRMQV
ncbi:MAG: flagellar hook-basal body complex protein FliE [Oscillospiraceae bacterium]|jgi:flagellar hook-basal body complex protein FliE|nr:flagellar hook-basal body complex protein FliE [Oscillospiraceae bacterium]